jgi:hypothetical protein
VRRPQRLFRAVRPKLELFLLQRDEFRVDSDGRACTRQFVGLERVVLDQRGAAVPAVSKGRAGNAPRKRDVALQDGAVEGAGQLV